VIGAMDDPEPVHEPARLASAAAGAPHVVRGEQHVLQRVSPAISRNEWKM